jgi:hypothetical protein
LPLYCQALTSTSQVSESCVSADLDRKLFIDALAVFLDASFTHTSACRPLTASALGHRSAPPEEHQRRTAVVAAHQVETDILTRLRLLAPSHVITDAETLHEAEHALATLCFAQEPDLDGAMVPVRHAREQFLRSARSALQLRDSAPIGHKQHGTGCREFRRTTQAATEHDGAQRDR